MNAETEKLKEAVARLEEQLRGKSKKILQETAIVQFMKETGHVGGVVQTIDRTLAAALPTGSPTEIFQFVRSVDQAPGDLAWSTRLTTDAIRRAAVPGQQLVEAQTWCQCARSADEGRVAVMVSARAKMTKEEAAWSVIVRSGWRPATDGVGPNYWDQETGRPNGTQGEHPDFLPESIMLAVEQVDQTISAMVGAVTEAVRSLTEPRHGW